MRKLIFILMVALQYQVPTLAAEKLLLTGSSTVAPLAAEFAKRYESLHKKMRVDVQTGGSSRGVADAREGVADIGMVSRALKPDEKDLVAYRVAIDGISIIANAANPVQGLTRDQVIKIYRGEITNWKAVGGRDAKIVVVNKAEGHSTLELFLNHFGMKASDVKAQAIIGDNEQGIKMVSGNPNAVAYVSIGSSEFAEKNKVSIKLLKLDGVVPSTENVKNGTYPLIRDLNLVTKKTPSVTAKEFIAFAQSQKVYDLIKGQFFVVPEKH